MLCPACGKAFSGAGRQFDDHIDVCVEVARLRSLAKQTPPLIRYMSAWELLAIEKEQTGRHCRVGVAGSYHYPWFLEFERRRMRHGALGA